ncbi:MAG: adenylyl-sulfate kinase [Candidatus Latescibacterota bacterium]|nr:adenylyl-sulfate kinase [Candidatus Latescibacterota bacterium]
MSSSSDSQISHEATDITWHASQVTRAHREKLLDQRGALLWLTGLSGSGKSTIAFRVEHALIERGCVAYVLDGDNVRHGLNSNLGFSADDRAENIRRIGEVGKLFVDAGLITLSSLVSPYRADRDQVRALLAEDQFFEIYVNTPLEICEQRDPKGLYKRARAGEIPNFTGISDPYEEPQAPELELKTDTVTIDEAARQVTCLLEQHGKINPAK